MTNWVERLPKFLSSSKNIAFLFALIGCFVLSLGPIYVKWSEQEISPMATVCNRFFFAALVFSARSGIFSNTRKADTEEKRTGAFTSKIILLLFCAGACAATNQSFWAFSLTQTNIGNSSLMHSLSPLFTTLLAWLFLKQTFDRRFMIGMAIAIGGSISIGLGDFQIAVTKLQGDGFALLSAIFFAVYLLIVEQLRINLSVGNILFWRCLLGTGFLLPILLFKGDRIIPNSGMGWFAIACLVITFVIGHWLITYALMFLSSSLVAVVLLLEPFLSSIQAWIFFGEQLNISEGLSFIIVSLGVYLAISSRDHLAIAENTPDC